MTMLRRHFIALGAAAGTAPAAGAAAEQRPAAKAASGPCRIEVGHFLWRRPPETFPYLVRYGVTGVAFPYGGHPAKGHWDVAALRQTKDSVEARGVAVRGVYMQLPLVVLQTGAERDRAVRNICENIRVAGEVGVPVFHYDLHHRAWGARTGRTPGRGGVNYSTWQLGKDVRRTGARRPGLGDLSHEQIWQRITAFLAEVVPAANRAKVRLACHPPDPPIPQEGLFGTRQVLNSVDDLKRFVGIHESPYHGLNFCQGTISEMLRDPGREIYDVIRWFGQRGKIFNVHFRNIRGGRDNFQEVFPDEGAVSMARAMGVYADCGYDGLVMPDHVPGHEDDEGGRQALAFCFGYMRALIQACGTHRRGAGNGGFSGAAGVG